jgi:hypothetical protein
MDDEIDISENIVGAIGETIDAGFELPLTVVVVFLGGAIMAQRWEREAGEIVGELLFELEGESRRMPVNVYITDREGRGVRAVFDTKRAVSLTH